MFIGKRISEVARVILFERYSILVSVRHRGFFHTVDDLFAFLILVKIIPGVSPAVLLAQSYGLADIRSVRLQLYADAGRLHAVLVLFVIPDLFNRNLDLFSLVLVGNSIAVVARAVLFERYVLCVSRRHFNFIHTVDNRRTVLVFVQSGPLMAPLIILVQRYGIADIGAAILELHRHAVRLFAVLVVLVIPDLFNGDLYLFRFMGVGNGIAVVSVVILLESDVLRIASGNSRLIYRVVDSCTVAEFIQVLPFILPVVAAIKRYRIADILSVCLQLHADVGRTDAVLVSLVVPLLFNRNVDLGCCMGIGQSRYCSVYRVAAEAVTSGQILFIPGIGDFLSVAVLLQMLNRRSPVIGCVQGYSSDDSVAVLQFNGQLIRTDAILVLAVIPGLGHSSGRFFFRIGNSDLAGAVSAIGIGRRAGSSSFYYIIGKCVDATISIVLMPRQVIPLVLPVVGLAQPLGINYRIFLVADNARNRLQSTLHRAHFFSRCEVDIAATVGSNSASHRSAI